MQNREITNIRDVVTNEWRACFVPQKKNKNLLTMASRQKLPLTLFSSSNNNYMKLFCSVFIL